MKLTSYLQNTEKLKVTLTILTMAKQYLEKIQVRLNQKFLKVLQDSPTRWNSSFYVRKPREN